MQPSKPSRTAYRVAMRRAAHQLLDSPVVFEDPLALAILGEAERTAIQTDPAASESAVYSAPLRAFLAVRSRVAEAALATAVAAGVRQYVVLGAGLDTFAYRNKYAASGLRVFEVDYPATQAWKREHLATVGIEIPPTVRFVSVDFEQQDLKEELLRAGLVPDAGAFFSWLGVTIYLERAAIQSTLAVVAELARPGGGIVFDYGVDPASLSFMQRVVVAAMAARVAAAGEPWRTYFKPDELVEEMRTLGFSDVEDLSGEALNERYLAGRTDGLAVGGAAHILKAFIR